MSPKSPKVPPPSVAATKKSKEVTKQLEFEIAGSDLRTFAAQLAAYAKANTNDRCFHLQIQRRKVGPMRGKSAEIGANDSVTVTIHTF